MTLLLKQSRQSESWAAAGYVHWVPLIDKTTGINYHPSGALKEAMRRINQDCYGHAYTRHGKQVRMIPALEKGNPKKGKEGRWHYQVAIEPPPHLTAENFIANVEKHWSRMDWANGCWAEPVRNPTAWNLYVLKLKTKPNFMESIDWENLYNPPQLLAQKINA